jgi:hypothetical protein
MNWPGSPPAPPALVRAELDEAREGQPLPAVLEPLYDDPAGQLPAVVQELARYWQAAIEPVWQQVRGLCTADVAYRMEQFANGGVAQVLRGLHPDLSFSDERLLVDKPHHCSHRLDLAGTGIVLAPCAFTWPTLIVGCCGVDQPVLIYPPRGVAELWEDTVAEQPDPLSALVGRTRANLLAILALPSTHHPPGRAARSQSGGGQPTPQDPQGRSPGHRPPPRPDGPLPAHSGRHHPARGRSLRPGHRLTGNSCTAARQVRRPDQGGRPPSTRRRGFGTD